MIYCQNCTTRNEMSRQFCWKCGSKLLVSSGTTMPEESFHSMSSLDEHVLERISAMENALATIARKVDSLAETVERIAANHFIDHTMIETLTESLEATGINLSNLEADWRKRIDSRLTEDDEIDRLGERMEQIIAAYHGTRRKQFTMWMERAYELLASDRRAESLSSLESAFAQDPSNCELGMLLAEVFFQAQNLGSARRCLSQVLDIQPDHFEATLLMGLLEKSHGNFHEAEQLLEHAVSLRDHSYSAHASLGSLFMDRDNRIRAKGHLHRALELKPTAMVHFMLRTIHRLDGHQRRAITHLKKATLLDPKFVEAFYQLGLACQELNWFRKAQECFRHAQKLDPKEQRYRHAAGRTAGTPDSRHNSGGAGPNQLSGLVQEVVQEVVQEELHLTTCWDLNRSK
jgi:tetratricopeptide (TPR) repeat protein